MRPVLHVVLNFCILCYIVSRSSLVSHFTWDVDSIHTCVVPNEPDESALVAFDLSLPVALLARRPTGRFTSFMAMDTIYLL